MGKKSLDMVMFEENETGMCLKLREMGEDVALTKDIRFQ